jgi:hypothetical protein
MYVTIQIKPSAIYYYILIKLLCDIQVCDIYINVWKDLRELFFILSVVWVFFYI